MSLTDPITTDELRQESGRYVADAIEREATRRLSTSGLCWMAETALQAALKTLGEADRALDELLHNREDAPAFDYRAFDAAKRAIANVRRQVRAGVTP